MQILKKQKDSLQPLLWQNNYLTKRSQEMNIKILFSMILLLLLTNCSHYYYTPNSQTVPLFQEKGETRISAATYESRESDGFVINTALSITNHIGLMGNSMYGETGDNDRWEKEIYMKLVLDISNLQVPILY
jgi:hypothetical protein